MKDIFPQLKAHALKDKKREVTRARANRCYKKVIEGVDLFPQRVQLTFKGKSSFATFPGTISSIVVMAVLLSFITLKFWTLINRLNPSVSGQSFIQNLNTVPEYRP